MNAHDEQQNDAQTPSAPAGTETSESENETPLIIAEAIAVSEATTPESPQTVAAPASSEGAVQSTIGAGENAMPHSRLVARILIISDTADSSPRAQVIKLPKPTSGARNGRSMPKAPEAIRFGLDDNSPMPLSQPPANHKLARVLMEAGHEVTLTGPYEWPLCFALSTQGRVPEVVIIEVEQSARDISDAVTLCQELQEHKNITGLAILAALPDGNARHAAMTFLAEAGIDDSLSDDAPDAEIALRVRAAVTLSRLRAELEATRDHLRTQLQTDDLTKLLNRRFFFQAAHREYGRARRYNHELSCLMLDVNHFKAVCSKFGYECGDAVLRTIANILRDSTRESDIVARFSEDKFVVMLPETTLDGAIALRENVLDFVNSSGFTWRGRPLPLEVSIGEASRTRDELSPIADEDWNEATDEPTSSLSLREEMAELLESADAALYVAKRGTRSAPFLQGGIPLQQPTLDELDDLEDFRSRGE